MTWKPYQCRTQRPRILRRDRMSRHRQSRGARSGLTVLELLCVCSVMSTLAAVLLPAISAAREAAAGVQCVSQLRQIGIALDSYHAVSRSFPPGWQWEPSENSAYGWLVPLLPYLEQRAVYHRVNCGAPLQHDDNAAVRSVSLKLLLCPSDITSTTFTLLTEPDALGPGLPLFDLPTASYFGVFGTSEPDDSIPASPGDGVFLEQHVVRMAELQRGLSNTLLVGERTMARVPSTWLGVDRRGADGACRLVGMAETAPNCHACDECEFASRHPGGSNFLWGDGRVTLLSENISRAEYQRLARRYE